MLCTGIKSEMAHKWAKWLHHPYLLGAPQCSARRSNLKWPTNGQSGYIIPAFSGVPNALHGIKSEMAHKWAEWLHHACLLRGPQCSAPGKIQIGPTSGQSGYITPAFSGVPNALHGDQI